MSDLPQHQRAEDPLLWAGDLRCSTCGAVACVIDAQWLDHDHLLASYAEPCRHYPGATFIVDAAAMAAASTRPRCAGVRTDGRPCRAYRVQGHEYCRHHLPGAA